MINVETVVEKHFPSLSRHRPIFKNSVVSVLRYLFHEREFKQFEENYPHLEGVDFVEQVLNYFDFSFKVLDRERERIPAHGRVIIVANHPIGSLDGLALLKMVGEVRPDVKAVANEVLYSLAPLRSLLLPVDNMNGRSMKAQLNGIKDHLDAEGAIIIFPAGEVSRIGPKGIRDGRWNSGFLRFATAKNAPILPISIDGRNSVFFYSLSLLAKPLSTLWLIREMFKQAKNHIDIRVGNLVYPQQYQRLDLKPEAVAKLFKKQVYSLNKKSQRKLGFVPEYEAVAHPENKQLLKREIQQCELLGSTRDGKSIYLYQYRTNSVIMREIGRLRELTFRTVKEGTGKRRDTDLYDSYYDHLVLWDDADLEIVGAYRMVASKRAIKTAKQQPALYTQSLFNFSEHFDSYFEQGLELGRSFVQPRYWGKHSLEYLWQGIGVYLLKHPELRYLFGPTSISRDYPDESKNVLIEFYSAYFGCDERLASGKNPYSMQLHEVSSSGTVFSGTDYKSEFKQLKKLMKDRGLTVPTLYKQYTELCEPGGAKFIAFNIDNDFADCVDGLILVDLEKVKPERKKRYMGV